MFLHVSVIYSFSFLCSGPLYDYTTINLPTLLLNLGCLWFGDYFEQCRCEQYCTFLFCWVCTQEAVTGPQGISICSDLVGTAKQFPRVIAPIGIPRNCLKCSAVPPLWHHLMRTLRKSSWASCGAISPLAAPYEPLGKTLQLQADLCWILHIPCQRQKSHFPLG